jgi:hypothetical protein
MIFHKGKRYSVLVRLLLYVVCGIYAANVNLLGDYIHTINKNTEALTDHSKEVGLQVNREIYVYANYRHQNEGQNHNIKMAKRSFENVAQFGHLGTTATNQNLIHEEINSKLN